MMGARGTSVFARLALASVILALAACSPAVSPAGSSSTTAPAPPRAPKNLTVSVQREELSFGRLGDQTGGEVARLTNDELSVQIQNVWYPQLATALPSADNGTWKVNSDGTMDVTWKIK